MDRKKWTFLSIIFFLTILIPFSSLSFYYKFFKEENEKHLFHYQNKLYFYKDNELLGVYHCQSTKCDYANYTSDNEYQLDIIKNSASLKSSLINNRYAFIKDENVNKKEFILLYDVVSKKVILDLTGVKNYNPLIANDLYIVKDINNLEGVISLKNQYQVVIKNTYKFIGISNEKNTSDNYSANYFVAKDNNGFIVLDSRGNTISNYFKNEIYDFNNQFIKTRSNDYFKVFSYDGTEIEPDRSFVRINFMSNYLEFVTSDNILYYYDYNNNKIISDLLKLTNPDFNNLSNPPYKVIINNNKLTVTIYTNQNTGTFETYSYDI